MTLLVGARISCGIMRAMLKTIFRIRKIFQRYAVVRVLTSIAWTCCILLAIGCGQDASTATQERDASDARDASTDKQPATLSISNFTVTENPANHLSAMVYVETSVETDARVEVSGPENRVFEVPSTNSMSDKHEIAVVGLYPDSSYSLKVTVTDRDGNELTSDESPFVTAPLPDDFPPIEIRRSHPDEMSPGVTLFNVMRFNPTLDIFWGLLLAIDDSGQVVWYHRENVPINDFKRLSNGNIAYIFGVLSVREIDILGTRLNDWVAAQMGADTFHHEVYELDSDNFVSLGSELREIDGYPAEDGDGTISYWVVADRVHFFNRAGEIFKTWTLFDYFDPLEVHPGFHTTFWDMLYAHDDVETTKDWTHGNAIAIDPSDNNPLVSVCHFDLIAKFDRETGEIIWKLGAEGDFEMVGEGEWFYHQHAPELTEDGRLLIYDNGAYRPDVQPGEEFTRVVEYQLQTEDPDHLTIEQIWEYRGEEPYYAPFVGDANHLPNGNVLISNGGLLTDPYKPPDPPNRFWARIAEVTHENPAKVVFEIEIKDDSSDDPIGYNVYRAIRLPSLYP